MTDKYLILLFVIGAFVVFFGASLLGGEMRYRTEKLVTRQCEQQGGRAVQLDHTSACIIDDIVVYVR